MQTPLVTCTQNLPFRWKHQCSLARQESVGGCALLVQQQRCKDAIFHCNQPAPVIQSSLTQSNLPTPLKWPRRTPHPHFSFHPYLSWQLVQCGPNSFGGWSSIIDWTKDLWWEGFTIQKSDLQLLKDLKLTIGREYMTSSTKANMLRLEGEAPFPEGHG